MSNWLCTHYLSVPQVVIANVVQGPSADGPSTIQAFPSWKKRRKVGDDCVVSDTDCQGLACPANDCRGLVGRSRSPPQESSQAPRRGFVRALQLDGPHRLPVSRVCLCICLLSRFFVGLFIDAFCAAAAMSCFNGGGGINSISGPGGSVKRVRLNRKTPALLARHGNLGIQPRPRVWKRLRARDHLGGDYPDAKARRLRKVRLVLLCRTRPGLAEAIWGMRRPQAVHQNNNNSNPIWRGSGLTSEELPTHSGGLNQAVSPLADPTQSQLSRPLSSGQHISMEHRLRRKHLLLNSDTEKKMENEKHESGVTLKCAIPNPLFLFTEARKIKFSHKKIVIFNNRNPLNDVFRF